MGICARDSKIRNGSLGQDGIWNWVFATRHLPGWFQKSVVFYWSVLIPVGNARYMGQSVATSDLSY